jgi:hypothetical protein
MTARPRGICSYCGEEIVKQSIVKHLEKCPKRRAAVEGAVGTPETLVYLRAECAWDKRFFIDLEVRGSAKLSDLDKYLRAIWLECCGHMSEFCYKAWVDTIPASRKVETLFKNHKTAMHLYDMGTTSETLLTEISTRQDIPTTKNPIVLLARNKIPEVECEDCEEVASWLCMECLYENNEPGYFCDSCVEPHGRTEEYGPPIRLVNSPRLGMCGYDGPATPPY